MKCFFVLTFYLLAVLLAVSDGFEFNFDWSLPRRNRTGTSTNLTSKREPSSRTKRYSDDDNQVVPRIIGGHPAEESQFPYQALISYNDAPYCGGTIIHRRWILTARHCIVEESLDTATVTIGTNRLDGVGGLIKEVEALVPNLEYMYKNETDNNGQEFVIHDIGLIRLKDPIVWSSKVRPTTIPSPKVPNLAGKMGTIAGWGATKTFQRINSSSTLMTARVRVLSQATCRRYWPFVRDMHLCTSIVEGKSVCTGDSGGGLIVDNLQYGIISTANDNCTWPKANLYTDVSAYTWWIERELQLWGDNLNIDY